MSCQAQFDEFTFSGRGAAMGGTSVALSDHASLLRSVAGLAFSHEIAASMGYRQDYLLRELAHQWVAVAIPTTAMASAMASYWHYGNSGYNEQRVTVGYAQAVSKALSFGATIDYLYSGTSDARFDASHQLTFSVSMQAMLGRCWLLGMRLFNPLMFRMGDGSDCKLPALMNIGVAYHPIEAVTTTLEFEQHSYHLVRMRGGIEYTFQHALSARIGMMSAPWQFTFGAGWQGSHLGIDVMAATHPTLGVTPQVGLSVWF
ncbi:MAG: hypothetical protein KBT04_01045 [Bacteroidales bacterium]|nr:hypothetical protein [Candidatus Colimorpha onthohippi]